MNTKTLPDDERDEILYKMSPAKWGLVESRIKTENCHCGLKQTMTRRELRQPTCKEPNYVCSAADLYRRMTPEFYQTTDDVFDDVAKSKTS